MKLTKKTIEEWIYTSKDGRETPLKDMNHKHLVNAFGVAVIQQQDTHPYGQDRRDADQAVEILRDEIVRRMSHAEEK